MKDEEIIELYWNRDQRAIRETQNSYQRYCGKIAGNILASFEDREECLNDTWLNAWNSIPPQRPESLKAYVGRITRNLCLNRIKHDSAGKRSTGEADASFEELADRLTDETIPETPPEDSRMRLRYLIARFIEGAYSSAVVDGIVRTVILIMLVLFGYHIKFDSNGGYLFSTGMWVDLAVIAVMAGVTALSAWFTLRDDDAVNMAVKLFLSNLVVAAAVGAMFLVWLIARIVLYPVRPIPNYETIHIAELWIGFILISAVIRIIMLWTAYKGRAEQRYETK